MTTIHRLPVPADSYDPKRPLNDLLIAQYEHFKHIAQKLPPEARATIPAEPAAEDREPVGNFIAAITKFHVGRKRELPRLVKPIRRKQPLTLDIAAVAEESPQRGKPGKPKAQTVQAAKPSKKLAAKANGRQAAKPSKTQAAKPSGKLRAKPGGKARSKSGGKR